LPSWATFPKPNERKNEPSVDGARTPANSSPIGADPQIAITAIWERLADEYGITVAYPTLRTYVVSQRAARTAPGKVN
jgi:hypothetical protein